MDNISWGTFGENKKVEQKEKYIIPTEELIKYKEKLLNECKNLICGVKELYSKSSTKEVYDVIVTLNSAKRSLNSIFIKEDIDDKRENYRVSHSES